MQSATWPSGLERPIIPAFPDATILSGPLPDTVQPCGPDSRSIDPRLEAGPAAIPLSHVVAWLVAGSVGWAGVIVSAWLAFGAVGNL